MLVSGCISADTALTQRIFAESVKFEHNGCVQGTVVNCRRAVGKLRRASLQSGQSSCITDGRSSYAINSRIRTLRTL